MRHHGSPWRTSDEIAYLRGLGSHALNVSKLTGRVPDDRLVLLSSYLGSMSRRTDWGLVNPVRVRAAVLEMIDGETKHRAAFVPLNGRGLCGARQYAQPVGEYRMEIRRGEGDDDDAA